MRSIFLFCILICLVALSAQELKLEQDWQKSLNDLQEAHKTTLDTQLAQGKHRVMFSLQGQKVEKEMRNTILSWSLYESDKAFSAYCNAGEKKLQIQGNIKGPALNILWKISAKGQEKELACTILNSQNDFEVHFKKATDWQNSGLFLPAILDQASDWRKYVEAQSMTKIANLAIGFIRILDNPTEISSRGVQEKWGKFFVGNYNKSLKIGNGKVISFHLLIYGGTGALKHEIIGGYLFLVAITGSWEGEYWIWQEE